MATAADDVIRIRPQPGVDGGPGPQETFLASPADIAIVGGAAGGGKTFSLLMEPLRHSANPEFGAVCFRRTHKQITNEGGLWDESQNLYPFLGAEPRLDDLSWTFPSGAKIRFAHLQHEKDKLGWKGAQIALLLFDQLEELSASQFWYMLSRNRSMSGIRPYVRGTCNPDPDSFLAEFLEWWIDQESGYPIEERSGRLRWFVRRANDLEWGDSRQEMLERFPDSLPKSVTFIPALLEDNPILERKDPNYRSNLEALPLVERERLLGGNWKIRATAGTVFNRLWFGNPVQPGQVPRRVTRVRAWDKAATEGAGNYTVGVLIARSRKGEYFIEDVSRFQHSAGSRDKIIRQTAESDGPDVVVRGPQDPGAAGKSDAIAFRKLLEGFRVRTYVVSGDKVTRAGPLSAAAEGGNVRLVAGSWNEPFLRELHAFPDGEFDDQVDAAADAYVELALKRGKMKRIPAMKG